MDKRGSKVLCDAGYVDCGWDNFFTVISSTFFKRAQQERQSLQASEDLISTLDSFQPLAHIMDDLEELADDRKLLFSKLRLKSRLLL